MMKKKLITGATIFSFFLPLAVSAVNFPALENGADINEKSIIDSIFTFVWPIFIAFAVFMFLLAGFTFLSANGEPGKIATAKKALIWGIVGVALGLLSSSIPFIVNWDLLSG